MTECQKLIDSYVSWLRDRIAVEELDGACQITTPFLDRHNDRIQLFIQRHNGTIRLTDDGYIIGDLEGSGCRIETPHRQQLLKTILNGFGVREEAGELYVEASVTNFAQKKHALIQAMLAVNDLFVSASPRVATLFWEDVNRFLEAHEIRFSPNVEFTGKTGFVHRFDFLIPKSKRAPERLVRAINNPNRDAVTSSLFAWTDTREVRSPDSRFLAVLNDTERDPSADVVSAFEGYGVSVVRWSKRDGHIKELAA